MSTQYDKQTYVMILHGNGNEVTIQLCEFGRESEIYKIAADYLQQFKVITQINYSKVYEKAGSVVTIIIGESRIHFEAENF